MKLKRLILLAVLPAMCLTANAQDKDYTPKKGDFTVATTLGYNSYTSATAHTKLEMIDYEISALTNNWSDRKLMVGFEGGWFFKDMWKLNLGGGISFTNNPGYSAVPGTIDINRPSSEGGFGDLGEIPGYRAVASATSLGYSVFTGVDRYFKVGNVSNLMWYAGARVGFSYAMNQAKFNEEESMGKSVAETWNIRGALTVGVDYFILPALYVGAQIDPVCYTYNMSKINPQAGLRDLAADSHNISGFAAPTIKIGFKF